MSVSALVPVAYNTILLGYGLPVVPTPQELRKSNGLLVPVQNGAALITGIDMGEVEVTIETASVEPPLSMGSWEEAVDVSVDVGGDLRVESMLGDVPPLPSLTPSGVGTYRVRCYALGRGADLKKIVEVSQERYLLISWPAEPSLPTTHKLILDRFAV